MGIVNSFMGGAFARENPVEGSLKGAGFSRPHVGGIWGMRDVSLVEFRENLDKSLSRVFWVAFLVAKSGVWGRVAALPRDPVSLTLHCTTP